MAFRRGVVLPMLALWWVSPGNAAASPYFTSGVGILGLEGGMGKGGDETASGVQAGLRMPIEFASSAFRLDLLLGYASSGMQGEARWKGDLRAYSVKGNRGLIWGYGGFELLAAQTPAIWYSLVEVPRVHLGYRQGIFERGFEFGARAGWALIGRYNPEGATRGLGNSLTPTLYALGFTRHLYVSWETRAFTPLSAGSPVWASEALLCGVLSAVALCATGRHFLGVVHPDSRAEGQRSGSWQAGLMVGVGGRIGLPSGQGSLVRGP